MHVSIRRRSSFHIFLNVFATAFALLSSPLAFAGGNVKFVSGTTIFTPDGSVANLSIPGITSTQTSGYSGTLQLRLVYSPEPYAYNGVTGYTLFTLPISSISGCGFGDGQLRAGETCLGIDVTNEPLKLPPDGTYYPILVLDEYSSTCSTTYCVDDVIQLTNAATGSATVSIRAGHMVSGNARFLSGPTSIQPEGTSASVAIAGITSTQPSGTGSSGTLEFKLVYSATPYVSGSTVTGYALFTVPFSAVTGCASGDGQLLAGQGCTNIYIPSEPITPPPDGTYYPILELLEYSSACAQGFCIDDVIELKNESDGGSTVTVKAEARTAADYLGEGKAGFTVWRPSTGYWYSIDGTGGSATGQWGAATDLPVIGDFDGDGKSDFAVFRPASGFWFIKRSSDQQVVSQQWGAATDIPVAGDFDGDGKTDFAVFRPATGYWYVIQSGSSAVLSQQFGESGDIPVVGDFDGDGKSDLAVYRPSNGYWYITQSSNNAVISQQWGEATDIPVAGDFDGDGKADIAVFRPSTGYWYIIQSGNGQMVSRQWGQSGDVPVARDYDGDGKADIAVWRPSTGYWYVIKSGSGETTAQQWGAASDVPVNSLSR